MNIRPPPPSLSRSHGRNLPQAKFACKIKAADRSRRIKLLSASCSILLPWIRAAKEGGDNWKENLGFRFKPMKNSFRAFSMKMNSFWMLNNIVGAMVGAAISIEIPLSQKSIQIQGQRCYQAHPDLHDVFSHKHDAGSTVMQEDFRSKSKAELREKEERQEKVFFSELRRSSVTRRDEKVQSTGELRR